MFGITKCSWFLVRAGVLAGLVAVAGCSSESKKSDAPAKDASSSQKAGGAKSGSAAKTAGQKTGSTAAANKNKGQDRGTSTGDTDALVCDSSIDGIGYCEDDRKLLFCSDGHWWELDCGEIIEGAFCGLELDSLQIDCWY